MVCCRLVAMLVIERMVDALGVVGILGDDAT